VALLSVLIAGNGAVSFLFGAAVSELGRVIGALVGLLVIGGLWLITRGRGMGFGDVKFSLPLGLLFGWPDILGVLCASFVTGAVVGIVAIVARRKTMASAIPFGPFLAVGSALIFFFALPLIQWWFGNMVL